MTPQEQTREIAEGLHAIKDSLIKMKAAVDAFKKRADLAEADNMRLRNEVAEMQLKHAIHLARHGNPTVHSVWTRKNDKDVLLLIVNEETTPEGLKLTVLGG